MYFGIACFPQKHVQDVANSFRKRYDPHYTLIPPHITLKEKFELDESQLEEATHKLEQIATEVKPFEIRFHKVSNFYPTSNTIYFAIENNQPLNELHEKIMNAFEPVEAPYAYIPHLTIAQKLNQAELHDIYGMLRLHKIDLTSKIDRFHLMYQLENGSWNIYQTFVLAK